MDTPPVFEIVPGRNERSEHVFAVVVKRSYQICDGASLIRKERDDPLRQTDSYYENGDPEWSTVQYESELVPCKPAVDVVIVAKAHPLQGSKVARMDVCVTVGDRVKRLAVFGDRQCQYRQGKAPVVTDPEDITEVELRYDFAYGGRDEVSDPDLPFVYPRNTMGTGVALHNTKAAIDGMRMPNIEDPDDLLSPERIVIGKPEHWPRQPMPQGLGWFQRTWYPRNCYAGVYPSFVDVGVATPEETRGWVPRNHIALAKQFRLPGYDARLNNGASPELQFDELAATERFHLEGLHPAGPLSFMLPGDRPKVALDIGKGERELIARLDTVVVRVEDAEVDMIWRAAQVYEGYAWLPKMKRLHAEVT